MQGRGRRQRQLPHHFPIEVGTFLSAFAVNPARKVENDIDGYCTIDPREWSAEMVVSRPRVLLADDHRVVSEGLRVILEADFEIVGVVEEGRALVGAAKKLQPDVIVADISMPHLNGIEAMIQVRREY